MANFLHIGVWRGHLGYLLNHLYVNESTGSWHGDLRLVCQLATLSKMKYQSVVLRLDCCNWSINGHHVLDVLTGVKYYHQCHPEKLKGPGQRVKVGPNGQGGFHSELQLQPSCKLKTQRKSDNGNSYPSPTIFLYL